MDHTLNELDKSSPTSNLTNAKSTSTALGTEPMPGVPGVTNLPVEPPISKKHGNKNKKKKPISSNALKMKGRPPKHGLSNTSTYRSWRNAKQRCTNPNHPQYKDYGGRGIECRVTVEQIVEEIGLRPDNKTLDRIDPNGHYQPDNLRWATNKQQAVNKRPPGYYRDKRIEDIRANNKRWVDNAHWWNLSVKLVNAGRLSSQENLDIARIAGPSQLPRASFDWEAPREEERICEGWIELPSLIRPGHPVRILGGPFGDMSDSPNAGEGIVTGLLALPAPLPDSGVSMKEIQVVGKLLQACHQRAYAGVVYTGDPQDACSILRHSAPERSLMAIAAGLIRKYFTVRFMPMAKVGEYLDGNDELEESWGPLRAPWLIVPDFHVRGPKGFGLEPWLLDDLIKLLKWRLKKHHPTIVYAADPWELHEKIGSLFNRHYAFVTPSQVATAQSPIEVADIPPPFEV